MNSTAVSQQGQLRWSSLGPRLKAPLTFGLELERRALAALHRPQRHQQALQAQRRALLQVKDARALCAGRGDDLVAALDLSVCVCLCV